MAYSLLIVDDEDLARFAVRKMVSRLTVPVEVCGEAENASAAREMTERLKPDIVVLDVNMPGMNGLEAARQIREAHPAVRVLIISAHDSFAFAQRAVQLQLDGYLLKPVRESDFAEEIHRIIGRIENARVPESVPSPSYPYPYSYSREIERDYLALLDRPGGGENRTREIVQIVSRLLPEHIDPATARRHAIEFAAFLYRELDRLPGPGVPKTRIDFFDQISRCTTGDQVREWLTTVLRELAVSYRSHDEATLLQRINEYLDSHSLQELSLERVAEYLDMSPQHLSRIFKERYGMKFLEFATEKRIDRAKELLLAGTCTVAEAGRMVGYTDPHYFSRLFRQTTGLSPRAYAKSRSSE